MSNHPMTTLKANADKHHGGIVCCAFQKKMKTFFFLFVKKIRRTDCSIFLIMRAESRCKFFFGTTNRDRKPLQGVLWKCKKRRKPLHCAALCPAVLCGATVGQNKKVFWHWHLCLCLHRCRHRFWCRCPCESCRQTDSTSRLPT